jgi:hypothetical protein
MSFIVTSSPQPLQSCRAYRARVWRVRVWSGAACSILFACAVQSKTDNSAEINTRAQIAATTFEDAVVVDCQLPGSLRQLGGMRTYLTPGSLSRLPAIDCRTRGGEYTVGDLASGTLSLKRWLPLAEKDNVEAQYYVARIYANGMDGVPVDYGQAAHWYQLAANKKYAPAMQELGYLYEQGLGVQKDALAGLNLQRQGSGLGEDLDYASKIAANKEESDAQIAALTEQLSVASGNVQDLQGELAEAHDKLTQNNALLAQDQTRMRDLRGKLQQAQSEPGGGDPTRIKQLQEQLAQSETALKTKQDAIGTLSNELNVRQAQLLAQLATSQSANSQLNGVLAANQSENQALKTKLAQAEQRAVQSQQELVSLRAEVLKETNQITARSTELQQLREHATGAGAQSAQSILASKQAEIDQQQQQLKSLDDQLTSLKKQSGAAGSATEATLAALRVQYAQQQQELQTEKANFAKLQSQSKDDRTALVAQLSAQLNDKSKALEEKQARLATLQAETDQLRVAYNKERDQHGRDSSGAAEEIQRDKEALRVAQDRLTQQREALQQLEVQSAAQQLKLVQEREALARQLSGGQQGNQQKIAQLESDVRDKDKQIADARVRITTLEQQTAAAKAASASNALVANNANVSYRGPQAALRSGPNPYAMIDMVRGLGAVHYHALVIGNSNYHMMPALKTPGSDAREIARLLEGRYGFDVKLLIDASRAQITTAMNEYARTLNDSDRLLIYYAGHGGTKIYPPERAFWLGVDADPQAPDTWLSAQVVSDDISQIHARHILLVADSCFSSVITHPTSTIVARTNDEHSVRIQWSRGARMVLTSGQDEPVVDGSAADPTHSLFAYVFITVLRQNDILMSGEMLAHEISSRMAESSARIGLKQTPTYSNLQDPQHNFGDFFFVPVTSSAQVASAR